MKPEGSPVSRSRPARHCRELLRDEPTIEEMVPALMLLSGKLSRSLSVALAPFCGGRAPTVSAGMPVDGNLASVEAEIEALASHSLLNVGFDARPLLATVEAAPVMRLVDRTFGGKGEVPDPLPESFPLSADLMITRLEDAIARGVSGAMGGMDTVPVHPVRRDTSLRHLAPFPPSDDLLQLGFSVSEGEADDWSFSLSFPLSTLIMLLGDSRRPPRPPRRAAPALPDEEPFASMPLPVGAVLVDMTLGFRRLASLRPGDIIPVPVARNVPLRIGGRTVASGTLGEVDDRVAIQINQAF
jgi:flagellar motor switch protein FliM